MIVIVSWPHVNLNRSRTYRRGRPIEVERLTSDHHPREIREAFLSSLTTSTKQKSKPGRYNDPSKATSLALARAATALPGDYAVMSNIVREMNGRLGRDWVGDGVIEISSSHGPGIWYVPSFSLV